MKLRTDFRTHNKFSKRIYYSFFLLWWTLHVLDFFVQKVGKVQFSFGFDTLTAYPDADPETTTCDGVLVKDAASLTWSEQHDALDGDSVQLLSSASGYFYQIRYYNGAYYIRRGFFLFDTSSISLLGLISATTFSLGGTGEAEYLQIYSTIHICSTTPASDTNLVVGDYDQVGSTSFASLEASSWVQTAGSYNNFSLNASGIANVSKTGISKFGTRSSNDINDQDPGASNAQDVIACYFADYTGTDRDPKLVVTYEIILPKYTGML